MLSSMTLSCSEFIGAGYFVSLNDSGEVVIQVSADDLQSLTQFLVAAPADFVLIGVSLTLCLDGDAMYVLDSGNVAKVTVERGQLCFVPLRPDDTPHCEALFAVSVALSARSFPGFVRLTALADGLQDQIATGNRELASLICDAVGVVGSANFRAASVNSLVGLVAAVSLLQEVIYRMSLTAPGAEVRKGLIRVGPMFDCDMSELWSQVETASEMVVSALEADMRLVLRRMEAIVERFDLVLFSDTGRFLSLISDGKGEEGESVFKAPTTRSIVGLDAAVGALRVSGVCGTEALEARLKVIKELLQPCLHGAVHKRSSGFQAHMTACLQSLFRN